MVDFEQKGFLNAMIPTAAALITATASAVFFYSTSIRAQEEKLRMHEETEVKTIDSLRLDVLREIGDLKVCVARVETKLDSKR